MALAETLKRLKELKEKQRPNGGGTNSKVQYWKPKKGKNEIVVLPYKELGDPFGSWGQHAKLFTGAEQYRTVPCPSFNKNEPCIICEMVSELQKADWKGNQPIWKPIQVETKNYLPIVDLADMDKGVQYIGVGNSVYSQLENWMVNISEEDDEKPFYDLTEPQRVIVTFDKDLAPKDMYKLDKKALKGVKQERLEEWASQVVENPASFLGGYYKTEEEMTELVDGYLGRVSSSLTPEDEDEQPNSKIRSLKKGE